MKLRNYHTHCNYCDGKGLLEEYVKQAIEKGFVQLGFSSHAPLPYDNDWTMKDDDVNSYFDEVKRLKEIYKDKLEINCGLEIDFIEKDSRKIFEKYDLEYIIGSVHVFDGDPYYSVDGSDEEFLRALKELFNNDIKLFVKKYYDSINMMIEKEKFDIIGHLDVIRKNNKNNKYFDSSLKWYKFMVEEVLENAKYYNKIIEINTGGMIRGYVNDSYPENDILKMMKEKNIKIAINSDAHSPKDIDGKFDEIYNKLIEIGFKSKYILINKEWNEVGIKE